MALFDLEPGTPPERTTTPVAKTFRRFEPDQLLLLPPSLEEWLPADHLARFVAELVDGVLDLSGIYADYTEARGYPPYEPRLMVRLLVYGYTSGVRSSRAIERRCADDVAFRYLAAGQGPDFRSIAKFRRRHLDALAGLFVQTLRLAAQLGLVRMGRVALDGTKLRANASKHKAMSYRRLVEREAAIGAEVDRLRELIDGMLADAEATDAAEDARFGADGREADLPGELARREVRLAKMRAAKQAAKQALEAEAAERARAHAEARERDRQARQARQARDDGEPRDGEPRGGGAGAVDDAAVAAAGRRAAASAAPKPTAQRNFTDPDARIMKNADGAFIEAYNGQAVVDEAAQIIVAADVTTCASDCPSLTPMLDQTQHNTGVAPRQALVDAGYCSEANLAAAADRLAEHGTEVLMATGRLRHGEVAATPRGRIPINATRRQRMARKLRTKPGRAAYARRKAIVEPVFGQITTCQDGKRLLLRGLAGARAEWLLTCAGHNLRKLFTHGGLAGLTPIAAG
ncbi:MAG TPA: IS1182 family transposase [Burkholderiales bacterium]|nr:IS1182 family transposase [Burkholderiales bacterium]